MLHQKYRNLAHNFNHYHHGIPPIEQQKQHECRIAFLLEAKMRLKCHKTAEIRTAGTHPSNGFREVTTAKYGK
jgi:hypothetical protein